MANLSKDFNKEDVEKIAKADDFHIAPFREDGKTFGTPTFIWSVAVDGNLYCRAYGGVDSSWYKAAIKQKGGKIEGAGLEKAVHFEAEKDNEINSMIDEAYKVKYKGNEYLNDMISDGPKNATIKVTSGK